MSFKSLKKRIRSTWKGKASSSKMEFAFRINDLLRDAGISNYELAKRLGTSNAYLTKVLRGDQNLSIESMHKIEDKLLSIINKDIKNHRNIEEIPSSILTRISVIKAKAKKRR